MLVYLCGPIEFADGGGKLWRRKLMPFLKPVTISEGDVVGALARQNG